MLNGAKADGLPSFIAIGPPRTGTTWLSRALRGHVGLPEGIKETQFFFRNYAQGLDWYKAYFRNCPPGLPAGEVAPTYFDDPEARVRIAATIPDCRIICSLRDPVARIYSQYKAWHRAGLLTGPFDYATQRQLLGASTSYAANVRGWRAALGNDNVMVVLYDDLRARPQSYLDSICRFIGIETIDLDASPAKGRPMNRSERGPWSPRLARGGRLLRDYLIRNRMTHLARYLEAGTPLWRIMFSGGPRYPKLARREEEQLRLAMRPEVEDLEELLGRDLRAWLEPGRSSSEGLTRPPITGGGRMRRETIRAAWLPQSGQNKSRAWRG